MATEKQSWPDTAWAVQARKEILAYAMSLTHYAKLAMQYGLGGYRDIHLIREMLPSIQAEARDILLACQKMRLARAEERYRLPNWVSYAIRDFAELDDIEPDRVNGESVAFVENIPVLAQKAVEECQAARRLGERPKDWERMTQALDLCAHAGQRIQEIIMQGMAPKAHRGLILDLVRDIVNGLPGDD